MLRSRSLTKKVLTFQRLLLTLADVVLGYEQREGPDEATLQGRGRLRSRHRLLQTEVQLPGRGEVVGMDLGERKSHISDLLVSLRGLPVPSQG